MARDHERLLGNRFRIVRRLGGGGSGHVYLAEDMAKEGGQRLCAVKELRPGTSDPEAHRIFCERFTDEEKYLRKLGGFNGQIPYLYECFTAEGEDGRETRYIAQEYIEGQTLRQKIEAEGPLGEAKVKEILVDLLPVLDHIHSHDFIHRDVTPQNIILRSRDDLPVLIDFGAVKDAARTVIATGDGTDPLTVIIGKEGYMAPEHLSRRPVPASDLYSLGITAIELLTGAGPRQLGRHPVTGGLLWRDRVPHLSPDFAAVLDKAVHEYAEQRYRDAAAMRAALEAVAVPESDDKLRRQLGELCSQGLERRPDPLPARYEKCATSRLYLPDKEKGSPSSCNFNLSPQDAYCPDCGAFNLSRLSADDKHLLENSIDAHMERVHPLGREPWLIRQAAYLTDETRYKQKPAETGDGSLYFAGFAAAGGLAGLAAGWQLAEGEYVIWKVIGAGVLGLVAGLLLCGLAWAAGKLALASRRHRLGELGAKKQRLLHKLRHDTGQHRETGAHLRHIEKAAAEQVAAIAKHERTLEGRLALTRTTAKALAGAAGLREEEESLRRALTQAQERRRKYAAKLLEVKLLRLHNHFQAQTKSVRAESGAKLLRSAARPAGKTPREVMGQAGRSQAEAALGELHTLLNEMFDNLRGLNLAGSEIDREWVARVFRAREITGEAIRPLMKQVNDLCASQREDAAIAPPPSFVASLDLLNAYLTYEDFYIEYQALRQGRP